MSNDSPNFPNVDNLTPFEYALAGVPVPEAQGSPSLTVIEQMRRMATEVDHAPVSQPRLREFLQTGGSIAKRNDRRTVRRRRPPQVEAADQPAEGRFIDITPAELSAPIPASEAPPLIDDQPADDVLEHATGAHDGPHQPAMADAVLGDEPTVGEVVTADVVGGEVVVADEVVVGGEVVVADEVVVGGEVVTADVVGGEPMAAGEVAGEPMAADTGGAAEPDPDLDSAEDIDLVHASIRAAIDHQDQQDHPAATDSDDPAVPGDPIDGTPAEAADRHPLDGPLELTELLDRADLVGELLDQGETLADGSQFGGLDLSDQTEPLAQAHLVGGTVPDYASEPVDQTELLDQADGPDRDGHAGGRSHADDHDHDEDHDHDARPIVPLLFPELDGPDGGLDGGPDDRGRFDHVSARAPSLLWPDADADADADGDHADQDEQAGVAAHAHRSDDDDGAILVPAVGGAKLAGILESDNERQAGSGRAVPVAAITSVVPLSDRRFGGGTLWALAGTAAAAAALVVGGIWWTNNLDNGTDTETATVVQDDPADASRTEAADGELTGQDASQGGSPEGSADESSQTTEFGAANGPSTSASSSTSLGTTTIVVRTTTSLRKTTTSSTEPVASSASSTTADPTTSEQSTSSTVATTAARQPTTTGVQSTNITPTTRPQATAPGRMAFVGDAVTIGSYGGDGAAGVLVELYADSNEDGVAESLRASTVTSSAGRYSFNVPGGCYVARFYPPDGFELQSGHQNQAFCVDAGQSTGRIDAIIHPIAPPAGPSSCFVEGPGDEDWRGVEVFENQSNWADSYTFYDNKGKVVVRTRDIGPADDIEGPTNREWHGEANNFDHRKVYGVSAERNGSESARVSCNRADG